MTKSSRRAATTDAGRPPPTQALDDVRSVRPRRRAVPVPDVRHHADHPEPVFHLTGPTSTS